MKEIIEKYDGFIHKNFLLNMLLSAATAATGIHSGYFTLQ
jgi:hypothetical protein